jgi:hypothetical protein
MNGYAIVCCVEREITLIATAKNKEIAHNLMKSDIIEYLMGISKNELAEDVAVKDLIELEDFELSEMTAWSNIKDQKVDWKILDLSEPKGILLIQKKTEENGFVSYHYVIDGVDLTFCLCSDGSIRRLNVSNTPEGFGIRVSCRSNEEYGGKLYPHPAVISFDGQILTSDEEERDFLYDFHRTKSIIKKIDEFFIKGKFD